MTRSARIASVAVVAAWAALVWSLCRPTELVSDWNGWRQADTQTIALLQTEPGSSILLPRIAWGGNGPGYVEAELPLYAWLVAQVLRLTGPVEWPGQLVSLLCVAFGGLLLGWTLASRSGPRGGAWGAAVYFTAMGVLFLAVSVQPDGLALLLVIASLSAFERYERMGDRRALALACVLTALAALAKPPTLFVGAVQFLWLALGKRERLRRWEPWVGWAAVLLVVGAYLLHAHGLYVDYGSSFGVLGGDRKFPTLRSLVGLRVHLETFRISLLWGPGPLGYGALVFLLWRRRVEPLVWALWTGYALLLLVAQRYTSNVYWGSHYHVYGVVTGAYSVAAAWPEVEARWRRAPLLAGAFLVAAFAVGLRERIAGTEVDAPFTRFGREVAEVVPAGTLVAVRSVTYRTIDPFWGGGDDNNFEDPRLFYLTGTHGYVFALDDRGSAPLERAWRGGARYYVEPAPPMEDPELAAWLERHAALARETERGRVFRLAPGPE